MHRRPSKVQFIGLTPYHAEVIAESIRAAKVVRMDDYGHFPFAEAPELFAAAAADFLRDLR